MPTQNDRPEDLAVYPLENVFPYSHQYYNRIMYDYREGKHYDRATDIYLEYEELKTFGLGA